MGKQIEEIINKILEDLKKLAQEHGALIIICLAGVYLWKNLNKEGE